MFSILKTKPFSNLYQQDNKNLSDRTVNLIKEADNDAFEINQNLPAGTHILHAVDQGGSFVSKLANVLTDDDITLLEQDGILKTDDTLDTSKSEPIDFSIKEKEKKDLRLTVKERALKHFNLLKKGEAYLVKIRNDMAKEWPDINRRYNPENDGKYPLISIDGKDMLIGRINPTDEITNEYKSKDVMPFISSKKTSKERKALYDEYLSVRTFKPNDMMKDKPESALANGRELMVVAKRRIPAKTCIGVYTGVWIPVERSQEVSDQTYTLIIPKSLEHIHNTNKKMEIKGFIDGHGILSRMNTTFDYDTQGNPIRQAQDPNAYNVIQTYFFVQRKNSFDGLLLPVCYTKREVKEGEELRFNYGLSPEEVKKRFSSKK